MKIKLISTIFVTLSFALFTHAQTDYNNLVNWAFHPNKAGTLIDSYSLDIAVVDENLATTAIISNVNNAMNDTGVDVFFIHPTILQNIASYTNIENIPIAAQNGTMIQASIRGQAGLLAKYGRFFAPRYRQATPPTIINSPLDVNQANVLGVAYSDVKDAFLNYLNNYNNGNKFIIASHSQGACLAGFLLRDVFDQNPLLREKLVVAVVAGIISNYSTNNALNGGWWQNIPFCSQTNECGCVMNWRTYKEGQIPPSPNSSHPASNPFIVSNGLVYSPLNSLQNNTLQDKLYYTNQSQPLRNFITLRSNVSFGGNVGYVAFDDLYSIRYLQSAFNQDGFLVQHTPKPNEQRPNLLLAEESNHLFSTFGYHQKDYNIYTWALLEQIDEKLNNCVANLSLSNDLVVENKLEIFPNPASDIIYFRITNKSLMNEKVEIISIEGKIMLTERLDNECKISIKSLNNGLYFVKSNFGVAKLIVSKF